MSLLYLIGEKFNLLESAELITVSSEHASLGKEYLYDYDQGAPFRFGAIAADDIITADLTVILNGDMEDWTESDYPDNFTDESNGTGVLLEETTIVHGGSSSCEFNSGGASNESILAVEKEVQPGWAMTFSGWLYESGSGTVAIRILLPETGQYLTSGGTWTTTPTDFGTETGAAWAEKTASFTIPAYSTALKPLLTLKITVTYDDASGLAYADDFRLWPHWDFVSVHGHNLGTHIVPEARSSDDNFSADDQERISPTVGTKYLTWSTESPHTFWGQAAAMVTDRYFRLKLEGTNHAEAIEVGELIVGQIQTLSYNQVVPYPIEYDIGQLEIRSQSNQIMRTNYSEYESRKYGLEFQTESLANFREMLGVMRRGRQGEVSAVLVPDSSLGDVCFGHFRRPLGVERLASGANYDFNYVFEEEGFVLRVT